MQDAESPQVPACRRLSHAVKDHLQRDLAQFEIGHLGCLLPAHIWRTCVAVQCKDVPNSHKPSEAGRRASTPERKAPIAPSKSSIEPFNSDRDIRSRPCAFKCYG